MDFIFAIVDEIWKIKEVDSDYVLGVNRKLTRNQDGSIQAVGLTMKPYVQGVAEAFRLDY